MEHLELLRELIVCLPARLLSLPAGLVERKTAPVRWSIKQELGHLLDSAVNNHQRIVRAQLEEKPALPGYDGDDWVELHGYQGRDWETLIDLWVALNRQLLMAVETAPKAAWTRTCTIADSAPLTVSFVFDDYVDHMIHHLRHMGINLDDVVPATVGMRAQS